MYFSSVRGVREKGSSGSGLSESRCSFLFRAFVPQTKEKKADRERERERKREESREKREKKKRKGRLDKVTKM